ncbi:DUF2855 family protein [Thalassotalea sp. M1531]|uniref:DUF2855 family protein n=1 Tax=Thalassotalea algicola TaxID=2716224 RepID=A0A7Y0LDG2_9GAMM|nr:DUF2855 family protein [Thalassotalea algicola]NMP31606.1 DUF2855 family protein [Thalassotalea algicola]
MQNQIFEVLQSDLSKTRLISEDVPSTLNDGQVLLKVDKFALTANNITYGITGDMLGYWRFFPAEQGWGRLPVMGFAEVVSSNHEKIKIGERVWGFFPMANYLVIDAGKTSPFGFSDVSAHRKGLSPVYSRFERIANNPFYQEQTEAYQMLIKGLYTTSWLIDDFMFDNEYFGASQYLITSASSKTSIALAFAAKQRGHIPCIGITSNSRVAFVESLGLYQQVISYDQIAQLDNSIPSVSVDMAGSEKVLTDVHQHFDQNLKFSSRVGATHINELFTNVKLAGPEPVMFFAPHQIEKRSQEWGGDKLMGSIAQSLNSYIDFIRHHIEISPVQGIGNLESTYLQLLTGQCNADQGLIVLLNES